MGSEPILPYSSSSFSTKTDTIPHGGLGTFPLYKKLKHSKLSPSHTVGSEQEADISRENINTLVTIPHGGLGTRKRSFKPYELYLSPSHTVGSEPQITTLIKIRNINNFVNGAPFSNEVNFPKSQIMQS